MADELRSMADRAKGWTDAPRQVLERAADDLERYREALEYIAHFDDASMETAMTLHIDMRGKAREALGR